MLSITAGFSKLFFQKAFIKKIKKLWPPPTRLLKKLSRKTAKTFFAIHHQLQNI